VDDEERSVVEGREGMETRRDIMYIIHVSCEKCEEDGRCEEKREEVCGQCST
jgi:hypothetical protein